MKDVIIVLVVPADKDSLADFNTGESMNGLTGTDLGGGNQPIFPDILFLTPRGISG